MTKIYIPYGTTEGQTAKIAEYIADVIRGHGHEAHTADIKRSGHAVPDGYDAVIVGASIHMGKHDGDVGDFVRKNLAVLERLPSAFSSVSLAALATPQRPRAMSRSSSRTRAGVPPRSPSLAARRSMPSTGSSNGT
jgi:menaquinone-dependent protoporphyrinogen IX oxidase